MTRTYGVKIRCGHKKQVQIMRGVTEHILVHPDGKLCNSKTFNVSETHARGYVVGMLIRQQAYATHRREHD